METMKKWMEKDLGVHVLGAIFLLAVALGVEVVPSLGSKEPAGVSLAFAGALPRPSALPLSLAGAAARPPAASASASAVKDPISLDEFVGLLDKTVEKPLAEKFAKAFMKEAPLQKAWEEYRGKGGEVPAGEFLQQVARIPEFRQLVNQFRSEPGFKSAFLSLARNPEVDGALRALKGALASPASALAKAGAGKGADARRYSAAAGPRRSVSGTLPGSSQPAAARGSALVASAPSGLRDAVGPTPISNNFGAASLGAPSTAGGGGGGGAWGPTNKGGSEGGVSTKLGPVSTVSKYTDAGSFLESIFATAPKDLKDALLYQCFEKDICNPVEACIAAGMYDRCVAACNDNPACSGIIPPTPPTQVAAGPNGTSGVPVGNGQTVPLRDGVDANGSPITYNTTNNYYGGAQGAAAQGKVPNPNVETGRMIGGAVGGAAGTVAGMFIGQALIPIPGVGGAVGAAIGGAIGTIGGTIVGGFIGGLF